MNASPGAHGASPDSTAQPAVPDGESAPASGRRGLGFWALTSLVVGNVIGSSIFVLPSLLAPFGGLAIVSWLITSASIGILAFVFAFVCIIGAGPETALRGFAGLLFGLPVFVWLQRKRSLPSDTSAEAGLSRATS